MIVLGQADDGRLILGSNETLPGEVKYVEYYREQRLFNLVYDTPDDQNDLMPCELNDGVAAMVHSSPNIMIIACSADPKGPDGEPYGYMVPLVQIGI